MPTYTYRRPDGTTFEVSQRISADPLTHDPESGVPVTRVISGGAGLQFKGDGFYLTDYVHAGSADRKAGAKADSGASESAASTDTGSTTAKPESNAAPAKPVKAAPAKPAASAD